MNRTTIVLPEEIKDRAAKRARAEGMSFGELVRQALARFLRESAQDNARSERRVAVDAMLRFGEGATGGPADLSEHLDEYLYGAPPPKKRS